MRSEQGTGRRLIVTALFTALVSGALMQQAHRIDAFVPVSNAIVVTNTRDAGAGSLRQAMLDANANSDPDTITFDIPEPGPFVIALQTPLPVVSHPVVIDGLTQTGATAQAPQVFLDGAALRVAGGGRAPGFEIHTSGATIRGIRIEGFPGPGVYVVSRVGVIAQNTISHNGGPGIRVHGGVTITENAIFANTGIGIDLGADGPTPNRPTGETATGSDKRPNYPIVIAVTNGRTTSMDFKLDGPAGTYTVEFFSGSSCGAAEHMLTGTSESIGRHRVDLGSLLPVDTWVVATATDEAGNTSEFSACGQVRQGPAFTWWMSQGDGDVTTTNLGRENGVAQFRYELNDDQGKDPDKPVPDATHLGNWSFTTVASDVGAINLDWSWAGSHSLRQVTARLEVFVSHQGKDVSVIQLVDAGPADCCSSPSERFAYKGTTTVVVGAGDTYGFRLRGSYFGAAKVLRGTFDVIVGIDGGG